MTREQLKEASVADVLDHAAIEVRARVALFFTGGDEGPLTQVLEALPAGMLLTLASEATTLGATPDVGSAPLWIVSDLNTHRVLGMYAYEHDARDYVAIRPRTTQYRRSSIAACTVQVDGLYLMPVLQGGITK